MSCPASGSGRVRRGGSWFLVPQFAWVARRDRFTPGCRDFSLGLRLVRRCT